MSCLEYSLAKPAIYVCSLACEKYIVSTEHRYSCYQQRRYSEDEDASYFLIFRVPVSPSAYDRFLDVLKTSTEHGSGVPVASDVGNSKED